MKIALVAPVKGSGEFQLAAANVYHMPQGGLQQLRRLTPNEHDVEVFANANDGTVAELATFDLVAITVNTKLAPAGYKIALEVKDRNPAGAVVMGGVHVSFNPEEAASYCDCVVVGEADEVWEQILTDFSQGRLEKFYYPQQPSSLDFLTHRKTEHGERRTSKKCSPPHLFFASW